MTWFCPIVDWRWNFGDDADVYNVTRVHEAKIRQFGILDPKKEKKIRHEDVIVRLREMADRRWAE